jgi:uncharacterized protein (DUF4415 family)
MGRPKEEPTHQVTLRLSARTLRRIDVWRAKQNGVPNRQEAIRTIVAERLDADRVPNIPRKGG